MILNLKYFGIVAEALKIEAEELDLDIVNVSELIEYFHSRLNDISFKVAVNHTIVDLTHQLKNNDEVALLPPFAGG